MVFILCFSSDDHFTKIISVCYFSILAMTFKLGEVRDGKDSDFEYFVNLCNNDDGWLTKYNKHQTQVLSQSTQYTNFKMVKVG